MAEDFDDLALGMTIRGYAAGQRLFGRFVLKRILGRGGMGMVWLAWDERLEREVALKFLPDLLRADEAALDDLKRETRRGLDLAHPHIVRVYDLVEEPNAAAIAMEFVDGQTLGSMRVSRPNKFFEVAEIAQWVRELCEALDYAHHRAKLVHRDLKPANLMINAQGELKVTDFGIARSISDSVSRVTMDRGTSGTLLYMSPQQAIGKRPAVSDDVYAIGATLYELLTSKPPFYSGNIARQLDEVDAPSIAERRKDLELDGAPIPPEWEATIAACLAKDPTARPQSASEVSERLGLQTGTRMSYAGGSNSMSGATMGGPSATASGTSATARTTATVAPTPGAEPPPPKRSKNGLLIALAAIVLLGGGAGAWFYLEAQKAEAERKGREEQTRLAEDAKRKEEIAKTKEAETREAKRLHEADARAKAGPQTFVVPDQHKTIQAAIEAAKAGDTIQVKPGLYSGSIIFKEGIKLIGDGTPNTRIDGESGAEAIISVTNCRSGTIEGLTLYGNGIKLDGILVTNSKIQILNCTIQGAGGSGIAVTDPSSDTLVKGNRLRENGRMGLFFLKGARGEAEGNICERNEVSGIAILTALTSVDLRKNQCRENRKHGIEFSFNASGTAEDNICEANTGGGIVVTNAGTEPTLRRNTCRRNGQHGINFGNGAGGLAENNTCEENTNNGAVFFDNTTAIFRGNQIRKNKLNGLQYSKGAKGVAEGNTIEYNEQCGIIATDPGTAPALKDNRISHNKQYGLAIVNNAEPVVDQSNRFSDNKLGDQTKR